MKYVGGYESLVALRGNSRDWDDVLVAMRGEVDARRIVQSQGNASLRTVATGTPASGGGGLTPIMSWPVGEEPPGAQ